MDRFSSHFLFGIALPQLQGPKRLPPPSGLVVPIRGQIQRTSKGECCSDEAEKLRKLNEVKTHLLLMLEDKTFLGAQ